MLPGDVGHRLPPWFFLMPSYWRDPKLDYVDEKLLAHLLAAGEEKVCRKTCCIVHTAQATTCVASP